MKNNKILIHAWKVYECNGDLFLSYTHYVYITEIRKYYTSISLLSPVEKTNEIKDSYVNITKDSSFLDVIRLPNSNSYIGTVKHAFKYYRAYKTLNNFDTYYSRFPVPFGWMQMLKKNAKHIIHYVGDPIDVIKKNPSISKLKKALLITFFYPEYLLFISASKKNTSVFTNGINLRLKLEKRNVKAKDLISSTLIESDYYIDKDKILNPSAVKFVYVGYLRNTKGIDTVLDAFVLFQQEFPNSSLSIIGRGEEEARLKKKVLDGNNKNIVFYGHIDDRSKLNKLLREHDIFCFASLSEGSPRVILEACANGLAVLSTPVGSLPLIFEDRKNIFFTDYSDSKKFCKNMKSLNNNKVFDEIRVAGYEIAKSHSIHTFIKSIFDEK